VLSSIGILKRQKWLSKRESHLRVQETFYKMTKKKKDDKKKKNENWISKGDKGFNTFYTQLKKL